MSIKAHDALKDDVTEAEVEQSISTDTVHDLLSNPRRRNALTVLTQYDVMTKSELATHLAAIENDKDPSELCGNERKRVLVSLIQCHMEKLDDARVIDWRDPDTPVEELPARKQGLGRDEARLGANAPDVLEHMDVPPNGIVDRVRSLLG